MKRIVMLMLGLALPLVSASCNKPLKSELNMATSVSIRYTIKDHKKDLQITDADKIAEITATIEIARTEKDVHLKIADINSVTFVMIDGTSVVMVFADPYRVDRRSWGQVYFANSSFYDKIADIVSKEEGRKIDLRSRDNSPPK